jgi:hypothetical protein
MPNNKVYINPETPLKFADSAQSPTKNLTLANLAAGAGRISAQHDLGDSARSEWYEWRATFQFATTPIVDETVDIYLSTSDGTDEDGQEGTSDAAIGSTNSLKNMYYIGSVIVTSTDTNHDMTAAGICRIVARYFSVVIHNNTADNLRNDTGVNTIMIIPIPQEVQ